MTSLQQHEYIIPLVFMISQILGMTLGTSDFCFIAWQAISASHFLQLQRGGGGGFFVDKIINVIKHSTLP